MKTSHLLLVGSAIAAYAYRDDLKTFFDKKTEKIANDLKIYAGQKVSITPYKVPKIGFNVLKQKIKLSGSLLFENNTPFQATLNSYSMEIILENKGQLLLLGKTPLLQANALLKSNAKSKVDYRFDMHLDDLSRILNDTKGIENYQMYVWVKHLNVSGYTLPNQKISIGGKFQKIIQIVRNPSDYLTNLLKL